MFLVIILTWSRYYEIADMKEKYDQYYCFNQLYGMDANDTINYGTIYDPHNPIKINATKINTSFINCTLVCK